MKRNNTFTAAFPNGGALWKKILQIIKDDIDEPTVIVTEKGMTIQSMDKFHVAFVNIVVMAAAAINYECHGIHNIGIRCDTFLKILNCAPLNSMCIMRFDSKKSDKLQVTFDGGTCRKVFDMKLLTVDSADTVPMPHMEHACRVSLQTDELQKCIKDLSSFSEELTVVKKDDDRIFLQGEGDSAKGLVQMQVSNSQGLAKIRVTYALRYIMWFTKAASLCDEAILYFDKQFPLLLHFENDIVNMRFFLAPKISEHQEQVSDDEDVEDEESLMDEDTVEEEERI